MHKPKLNKILKLHFYIFFPITQTSVSKEQRTENQPMKKWALRNWRFSPINLFEIINSYPLHK